jgi:hypothetical protein
MYNREEEEACCCGSEKEEQNTCACDSACACDDECDDSCGCGCEGHDHNSTITMTDTETGEEYTFALVDDFLFEDEHYCVLVSTDDENDPEMVIARVVTMEDGSEGLMSLDEDEHERVYAEYERIIEEEADEDEDDEEEG